MRMLLAGLAGLLMAAPASADTLDNLVGNSLMLTDANGNYRILYVQADHTFFQHRSDSVEASGPWKIDDQGRFCFTPRGEATSCLPAFPAGKAVGDAWEIAGPRGDVVWKARILAGKRQDGPDGDKPE